MARPWRQVCEPHPDVLDARFSDAEFSANPALADQGEGGEEYTDSASFFRITYATEALQRVLTTTIARLAGKGGDPAIGLRTNFGGGKTHTMLALHHLAGAVEAGYRPEALPGMAPIFEAASVETVGHVIRAVFVGAHRSADEGVVETVTAHARDLKLEEKSFGFEDDRRRLKTATGSSRLVLCCSGMACCSCWTSADIAPGPGIVQRAELRTTRPGSEGAGTGSYG